MARVPTGMRAIGLDVGTKTIGVALSDELYLTAQPLVTLERAGFKRDLEALGRLASEHEVAQWVVGLPLNMNGTEGPAARLARSFQLRLAAALRVPVDLFDERLSSFEAETRLRDQGFSSKDRRGMVDAEAAAVILQGWLDGRAG